jgi:repressor LexA
MSKEITVKQQKMLDYIINYSQENGFPPTRAEISTHFNLKQKASIINQLRALEKKGFIKIKSKVARGIEIVGSLISGFPIVGEISAGSGLPAEENILGMWNPIKNKNISKQTFALQIRGESMIEAGIFNGDTVLIDPTKKPKNGTIGAVLVDGDAVVKYIFYGDGSIILKPANSAMQERIIEIDNNSLTVIGSVVAVWREINNIKKM